MVEGELSDEEDDNSELSEDHQERRSNDSVFTDSSGSSRSPTRYDRKKGASKPNVKPASKSKSRCVDRYLIEESSASPRQDIKQESDCIGHPNEFNHLGILDMTQENTAQI